MVHIHADELLRQRLFHVARKLHGIVQRFFAIVQRVLDAVAHQAAAFRLNVRIERAEQRVGAKGQRQIVRLFPPLAEIDNQVKAAFAVGQLRLMDDESGIDSVIFDCIRNLVEGHHTARNPVR